MEYVPQSTRSSVLSLPRERVFWAASLGHITNDLFMGMGVVLVTFMSTGIIPMSAARIGLAVSAREILGALSQPLFGWLSDRSGGRWLGAGGVAWIVVLQAISLVLALQGRYWLMVVPFALAGLGSGAFHPVGTMHASGSTPSREASNTAFFFLFGQMGLGIGPALAGLLLDRASGPAGPANPFTPIFVLSALALPGVIMMSFVLPNSGERHDLTTRPARNPGSPNRKAVGPMLLLMIVVIVILRSVVHTSSSNFAPVLFQRKGWSPAQYGALTSLFWVGSAVMGVVFGQLADRFDRRWVIAATLLFATPALWLLPAADGLFAFLLALATGGLAGGAFSILVVLAQHVIPTGRALASGAILGFTFVTGWVGNLLIGVMADGPGSLLGDSLVGTGGIGLEASYQVMAGMALVAGLLTLALPEGIARSEAPPTEQLT